jgi:LCP family protein required for cell wall assembly
VKSRDNVRRFSLWFLLLLIAAALGGSIAYAARPWYDAAKVLSNDTGQALPSPIRATFTPVPTSTVETILPSPTPTATLPPIKSESGRINFLLLGSDNDAKNIPGTDPNTQVIIFVSYDPKRQQIYSITIPRDLYVPIPGFLSDKIDTAPGYDKLSLEITTVETNFHVHVDHYAWIGLQGFINVINSLGGVDVNVMHPMVEDDFPDDLNLSGNPYAIRRFFIPAGPQHLDGVTALEYVRARHADYISDFGRSQRQQQVLQVVRQKLNGMDLQVIPSLIEDMGNQFKTDIGLPELLSLAKSTLGITASHIHQYYMTDTNGFATDTTLPDGNEILSPNWANINSLFSCVMSNTAYKGCSTP